MTYFPWWELLVLMAAGWVGFLVLRPYVPAWAWFAMSVFCAFLGVVDVVSHGLTTRRAGAVGIFVVFAALLWWRFMRDEGAAQRTLARRGSERREP